MVEEFTRLNGVPLLEAIQYNSEGEQRVRAAYILDHHFPSFSLWGQYCIYLLIFRDILYVWNHHEQSSHSFFKRWRAFHHNNTSNDRKMIFCFLQIKLNALFWTVQRINTFFYCTCEACSCVFATCWFDWPLDAQNSILMVL